MLRISVRHHADRVTLKVEGRLVDEWARELRNAVLGTTLDRWPIEIDLRDVTFADEAGEEVLCWLHRLGAHFQGCGSFSSGLCRRLGIPLRR